MKLSIYVIAALAITTNSFAQDQVKVGDVLDLEERIMIKKMTDELTKPNPNAPAAAPAPVIMPPRPTKIAYPTETLAVYGTSATFYEGQLTMGGRLYTVRAGSPVQEYIVNSVTPYGIELKKFVQTPKKKGKHRPSAPEQQILFAPLVLH